MARSSQVQMMAKQMGGKKKAEDAYRAYMKQIEAGQEKEGKAGFWGSMGGIGGSLLAPALVGALGLGMGPAGLLLAGALKGGIGGLGKDIGYKWGGGGQGIGGPDLSKFTSSPYGRAYAKQLFQGAGDEGSAFEKTFSKFGESTGHGALAGLTAAGANEGFQELFGDKLSNMFLENREGISPVEFNPTDYYDTGTPSRLPFQDMGNMEAPSIFDIYKEFE